MNFTIEKSLEVLKRTPLVLTSKLQGLSEDWTHSNEGGESWSPYDILGHLIHGEKTDWIPRMKIILSNDSEKNFESFDRFAQFNDSSGKTLDQLLLNFTELRAQNIATLVSEEITEEDLTKTGNHPSFGETTLSQLLATWVAHDLNHIAQISRVMAKQYKADTGPWTAFLKILKE